MSQCGVVLSIRPQKDALQIWNRSTEEIVCLEDSLRELREVMSISDDSSVNYQAHRVNNRPTIRPSSSIHRTVYMLSSLSLLVHLSPSPKYPFIAPPPPPHCTQPLCSLPRGGGPSKSYSSLVLRHMQGSLDFNSHVLERKKYPPSQHQSETHNESSLTKSTSNGYTRTSKKDHHHQHKHKHAQQHVDTNADNDAAKATSSSPKENGHASPSPKPARRQAEGSGREGGEEENSSSGETHHMSIEKEDEAEKEKEKETVEERGEAEGEAEVKENEDDRERTMSWGDMPSDDDDDEEEEEENTKVGRSKHATANSNANGEEGGAAKLSVSRSIDWAEMAEEGEDEVSDTRYGFPIPPPIHPPPQSPLFQGKARSFG
jgi:hypothetical protein